MIHHQDDTVQLHHGDCLDVLRTLPDNSVDAVICDPPYGLANTTPAQVAETITAWVSGDREHLPTGKGFMGKSWDAFVPPVAVWDECLRVLKPGGHALVFAGSRTHDLMTLGLRLAGFDIRDTIAWLYGSGFPKSLDIGKAIDKANGRTLEDGYALGRHIRERREAAGLTRAEVNAWFGYRDGCEHWERQDPSGSRVPTLADWQTLRERLGLSDDHLPVVERMEAEREVVGSRKAPGGEWTAEGRRRGGVGGYDIPVTAPATPAAQQWQGWGSALKPANEPIVVARKPLTGTLAANVLQWGTGGLNVDGCRVGMSDADREAARVPNGRIVGSNNNRQTDGRDGSTFEPAPAGRWPTNVVLDADMAEALDAEQPVTTAGAAGKKGASGFAGGYDGEYTVPYGDTGGPSRFFPVFKYQAKAPTRERASYVKEGAGTGRVTGLGGKVRQCNVCETRAIESGASEPSCGHGDFRWEEPTTDTAHKVAHPTVKPLELMRWLCRLVTPPGGTILEPFAGSGTTVEAAILEGFRCIAVEREADYLPLIMARLERARPEEVVSETYEAEPLTLFGDDVA